MFVFGMYLIVNWVALVIHRDRLGRRGLLHAGALRAAAGVRPPLRGLRGLRGVQALARRQ